MKYTAVVTYREHPQVRGNDPQEPIRTALEGCGLKSDPNRPGGQIVQIPYGTYFGSCEGDNPDDVVDKLLKRIAETEKTESMHKGKYFVYVVDNAAASQWGNHESVP